MNLGKNLFYFSGNAAGADLPLCLQRIRTSSTMDFLASKAAELSGNLY